MKKIIILIIIAVIVGGGVFVWMNGSAEEASQTDEPTVAEVERGSIKMSISTTGRVVSNLDVEIKCRAGGEVISLPFDVSDKVEARKLIVEIDPIYEQRKVDQATVSLSSSQAQKIQANLSLTIAEENLKTDQMRAEASLKSAEARYKDAVAKAERLKQLLAKKLTSQEEYDTANASAIQAASDLENAKIRIKELKIEELGLELKQQDVSLAEARVKSDQINLSDAEQRLEDTKVYAPISGVVSTRDVQIGQIISSGISNVGGGTTVMTLSDLSRIFILASVDESDIGKVRTDQAAEITVDAFPGMRFSGNVVRIATKGISSSNVVTFEVKIEVLSRNKKMLKPEMTANVEIIAEHVKNIVLVPVGAIFRGENGSIVNVLKPDGTEEERAVEKGITDGQFTEIKSGLTEGEKIIYRMGEAESKWRTQMRNSSMRRRGGMGRMFGRRRQPAKKK
ncbi:MAG: efflux RND transporter periplasmic adaptor subunit [Planctomycetota bacterium]|nr:MAG: efflux RND transporter periplasmic adaptor subunit [Planctomycetota bacterium]